MGRDRSFLSDEANDSLLDNGSNQSALGDFSDIMGGGGRSGNRGSNIESNREDHFSLDVGRFRDPDTGKFEVGSPPPDYSSEADRYRAEDGRFKSRSSDLYDEPKEVKENALWPEG